ncbi:MAG: thiamine phosphate synthase, partial [Caulobacteraceae bacterium]
TRRGHIATLRRRFVVTAAAHTWPAILRARRSGVAAVVFSPVFPTKSPAAGTPMGILAFAAVARRAKMPVYALGGVNPRTVGRLIRSGAAGLAAIEGLAG